MKKEIELTIIIVNYNTGKLLAECVESIKKTTNGFKNPSCEIVVVDNSSSDESLEGIKNTSQKLKISESNENMGFAKAVNLELGQTRGKYALLLNPDTRVKVGAIKKLLGFAKKTPDAGVVGVRLLEPNGRVQESVFHFPTIWRSIQEFWLGKKEYSKYTPKGKSPIEVDALVGAAFLITPLAKEQVGLLDERYFMYFEDLDYCRRVKRAGLKVYYLPEAEVVHHHGVSGRSLADEGDQWRRLIPSSKIYHGILKHYLINSIIWSGQKLKR